MTAVTAHAFADQSAQELYEDEVAYRAALPRFTITNGKQTFQTDRADLAQWEATALDGDITDRENLRNNVYRSLTQHQRHTNAA